MSEVELSPQVQSTQAFEALQTGSWLAASGLAEPVQITELTARYHAMFPSNVGRRVQNHACQDTFKTYFDLYWGKNGSGEGLRQDGLAVYEDGSVLESWLERYLRHTEDSDGPWTYTYRATHLTMRTDANSEVDDLLVTTCFDDGFLGKYIQENVFMLGDEAFQKYVEEFGALTPLRPDLDLSYAAFRRYMFEHGRRKARPACFPFGTRYSKNLFGLISQIELKPART